MARTGPSRGGGGKFSRTPRRLGNPAITQKYRKWYSVASFFLTWNMHKIHFRPGLPRTPLEELTTLFRPWVGWCFMWGGTMVFPCFFPVERLDLGAYEWGCDINVGAQWTLGGKTFLPEDYVWKINKMPEFYVIFAGKIIKMPEFLWYLPENLKKYTMFEQKWPNITLKLPEKMFPFFLPPFPKPMGCDKASDNGFPGPAVALDGPGHLITSWLTRQSALVILSN